MLIPAILLTTALTTALTTTVRAAESTQETGKSKVYKTTDERGRPVFTDQAPAGSQEVEIDEPMTFPADVFAEDYRQFTATKKKERAAKANYRTLTITSPANDETIRNNAGNMEITFNLSPGLKPGHKLQLLMDGAVRQEVRSSEPIALTNVDRGTHTLQLQVVDGESKEVLQSGSEVSFTILRHSILHPKPKPRTPPPNPS